MPRISTEKKIIDRLKLAHIRAKAEQEAQRLESMRNMNRWTRKMGREKPRWTSVLLYEEKYPLNLLKAWFASIGFASRVRKGKGRSKNYYLDVYGWNSWEYPTKKPRRLSSHAKRSLLSSLTAKISHLKRLV